MRLFFGGCGLKTGAAAFVPLSVVFCLACLSGAAIAQEPAADDPADVSADADGEDAQMSDTEARFRNLVCTRAADFEDPSQATAIAMVARGGYRDQRFDEPIRAAMGNLSNEKDWDIVKVQLANQLLPFSTLSNQEQVDLALSCYVCCDERLQALNQIKRDRQQVIQRDQLQLLREMLRKRLQGMPDATTETLSEQLEENPQSLALLSLVELQGLSGEQLLPHVIEAAASKDAEVASQAMVAAGNLIDQIKVQQQSELALAQESAAGIDEKMLKYSKRIIARYDKNNDGSLVRSEWQSMLLSPEMADQNGDGLLTAVEYAVWMQARNKR